MTNTGSRELAGKNAFISGGTSGINLAIARRYAAEGANVCVIGRDSAKAERAGREIAREGADALGLSADVRDFEQVSGAMRAAADRFGPLDIVIAGAAGNFLAPAVDISAKGFKTVVDIDLIGTYNVFRAAFDVAAKPGASFIAITAPQGMRPQALQAPACAAKAGVNMLVRCLALEWGPGGVRVNAISPGPIEGTEGVARLIPTAEARQTVERRLALRRLGTLDEIAEMALFVASDRARYVTGAILDCDGGSVIGDASADCLTPRRQG